MRITALALLLASLFLLQPSSASAADGCEFILGFKALRDAIPDLVGDCRTDQTYQPSSGDAIQETTAWHGKGGLLVWRRADNWTAFTDGSTTWISGPNGIQSRGNSERFAWEADYASRPQPAMSQVTARVSAISQATSVVADNHITISSDDPALVVVEHSTQGRVSSSQTMLASTTSGSRSLVVTVQTSRYGTLTSAQESFDGLRSDGWEQVAAPTIGDQSMALRKASRTASGTDLLGYCIVFRRGTLVGSVVLVGHPDAVSLDDAVATARATAENVR